MAQIIQEIRVEVAKKNTFQALVAKQYDYESRYLKVTLVHDGEKIEVKQSSTALINANRIDGQSKSFLGVANDDGTATVPLNSWMLELDGELHCDVSIVDAESRKLTSTTFLIFVEKAASGNISEDPDVDVLVSLIEDCNVAVENANHAAEQATKVLDSFVQSVPALNSVSLVQLLTVVDEIGLSHDQHFLVIAEDTGNVYYASVNELLAHASGKDTLEPVFNVAGTGIPYTEVAALPAISEESKNKVYKKDGKYYSIQKVEVGSGTLYPGAMLGKNSYLELTSEAEDLMTQDPSNTYELFTYEVYGSRYTSTLRYCCVEMPGSERSMLYDYDFPINVSDLFAGSTIKVISVTELGARIFGGKIDGWKNFITGEKVE